MNHAAMATAVPWIAKAQNTARHEPASANAPPNSGPIRTAIPQTELTAL